MNVSNKEHVTIQVNIDNSKHEKNNELSACELEGSNIPKDHTSEPNSGAPPSVKNKDATNNNLSTPSLAVLVLIVIILLLVLAGLILDGERFERILKNLYEFFLSANLFI